MACRITEICIDCHDVELMARFWSEALGWELGERDADGVQLVPPASVRPVMPTLILARVPETKVVKNRLHLDVNATDREAEAEVRRLLDLGAQRVDIGQGDVSWTVLADPEGNEFCVLRSRVDPI
jgi:predicted enzyme related to lactoylglutathione lyase